MNSGKSGKQFKEYAIDRIKAVIKSLKNMKGNFVTYAEKSSSIFKNETKCIKKKRDSVILITGGDGDFNNGGGALAEIYDPQKNSGCRLPPLPNFRFGHTQDESILCGGSYQDNNQSSCLMWESKLGNWEKTHTMLTRRFNHMSWASPSGIYLMGGFETDYLNDVPYTSFELLTPNQVLNSNIRQVM